MRRWRNGVVALLVAGGVAVSAVAVQSGENGAPVATPTATATATPAPGTRNLFVTATGCTASPVRQSTPTTLAGAASSAKACTATQARSAANVGDDIGVDPSITAISITSGTAKTCTLASLIRFRPLDDTPNSYGYQSSTVLSGGVDINLANACVEVADFDLVANEVVGRINDATQGAANSSLGATPNTSCFTQFTRLDATQTYFACSDVRQIGGTVGGYDACNGTANFSVDADGTKVWSANGSAMPDRVTLDGTTYHDIYNTCGGLGVPGSGSAKHIDCLQIGGGTGHIIRNLRMYQCPDQGIFARPANEAIVDMTVENNTVGDWTAGNINGSASNSIYVCKVTDDAGLCSNVDIVNNTALDGNIVSGVGGDKIANNFADGFSTNGSPTVTNNAKATGSGTTGVKVCTPSWTVASPDATADPRVTSGDTCLKDAGNATTFATVDYVGTARPQGAAPEIGAYELPVTVSGLDFPNAGQAVYGNVDQASSAFTWLITYKLDADGTFESLLSGQTSGGTTAWWIDRQGPGLAVTNSLALYRRTTNDDFVWTDSLLNTASDGYVTLVVTKWFNGGTCSPANRADASCPVVSLFTWNSGTGAWAHKSGSPSTMRFQLANTTLATVNTILAGNGDSLDGQVYQFAGWKRQLTQTEVNDIMAARSNSAIEAESPDIHVSARSGMASDESGHGLDRSALTSGTPSAPPALLWDWRG